jgi:hypothetical protein
LGVIASIAGKRWLDDLMNEGVSTVPAAIRDDAASACIPAGSVVVSVALVPTNGALPSDTPLARNTTSAATDCPASVALSVNGT